MKQRKLNIFPDRGHTSRCYPAEEATRLMSNNIYTEYSMDFEVWPNLLLY